MDAGEPEVTLHAEAAGITHRGTVRENNEDCIAIGYWTSQETMEKARGFDEPLDLPFVAVVADGMGGHNDGERASLLVAKSLARRLPAFGHDKIGSSVRAVNAELYATVAEKPEDYVSIFDIPRLLTRLKKEMRQAASKLDFEKAAEIRDRIQSLEETELEYR